MPKPSKQSIAAKARYVKYRERNNTQVKLVIKLYTTNYKCKF